MVRESINHTAFHLIVMHYSTVELRLKALEDVLAGPHRLHPDLATKLPEIRELRSDFADAQTQSDPDAFPPVRRAKPRKRAFSHELIGRGAQLTQAAKGTLRQFLPVRPMSREFPEAEIMAQDSFWWTMAAQDSAIYSMPDGTSAVFVKRDPQMFRELGARALLLHKRMWQEWPQLSHQYQAALGEITSTDAWARTFGVGDEEGA